MRPRPGSDRGGGCQEGGLADAVGELQGQHASLDKAKSELETALGAAREELAAATAGSESAAGRVSELEATAKEAREESLTLGQQLSEARAESEAKLR